MELWKFILLTYLSVIVIEGVPSINFVSEDGSHFEDELEGSLRQAGTSASHGLFQRWKEKRKTTAIPLTTTTLGPATLADLNLRIQQLEDQINNLFNAMTLEEQQIAAMSQQITSMSQVLNAVFNAVIAPSG
ncbi:hypothetical protein PVAND_002938 [Polypedilum vanderplanki]|uniref:Secreted protein n=1 Tax=Polypedilum vanderplanki TaxID=319348 RepID=A0A9J6BSI8_POLVA|nr:hypothetical protein PVAND_002938 [Polypedilum vanderplanki]